LTSYSWEPGWLSSDPRVGQQVISAVEQELAARGLTKGPEGQSDVTVAYATLQRTDVNFKAKRTPAGVHPSYPVGSLVIVMRNPRTQKELFRGRADTPIDLEIEKLKGTINDQVAQIFAKYPKRHGSRG
jgi:hypothetical protein